MFASRLASVAIRSKVVPSPFSGNQFFRAMSSLTSLPSVEVMQGFPDPKKINITDYCAGKNVILVGLPGMYGKDTLFDFTLFSSISGVLMLL